MTFNPRGKTIKEIKEALTKQKITKAAVLKEFTERLNRPGKGRSWTTRYEREIKALEQDRNIGENAFPRSSGEATSVNRTPTSQTVDKASFKKGDVYEKILLETFVNPGENSHMQIRVRPAEVFPSDWRVNFPKALREENPVGTQFRATVTVSASSTAPDTLFLRASSKTIRVWPCIVPARIPDPELEFSQALEQLTAPQTPDLGKSGSIRKPSNLLKKLPSVYSPEAKETFQVKGLEDAVTNNDRFICALSALVFEIRSSYKGKKTVNLSNGERQPSLSGEHGFLYAFRYDGDEELFEGARIDIQVGSRKIKGSLVSIFGTNVRTLVISLDEDCGSAVEHCSIAQDDATFFESLQNRLEIENGKSDKKKGKPVGMNFSLADDLLNAKSKKVGNSTHANLEISELNEQQVDFTRKMIENSVSFLWGPPGTGKTQTLGAGLSYFYDTKERSLITSNTNKAVDQVLLKLCNRLHKQGKMSDLEEGKIVRVGRISHEELEKNFGSYVTVDGIATRRGSEMQKKINELEKEKPTLEIKLNKLTPAYERFKELKQTEAKVKSNETSLKQLDSDIKSKKAVIDRLTAQAKMLEKEKIDHGRKGFFGKAFGKSIDSIEGELSVANKNLVSEENQQSGLKSKSSSLKATSKTIELKLENLQNELEGQNFAKLEQNIETLENDINKINAEISKLNKEMEGLRKTIISDALIVGATSTKAFLSPKDLGKFENVIVDEASMALLPAVYFIASQSQKRCVISGDFRQIPAIVQSKNKTILDIIGQDVFQYSGMEEAFEDNNEGSNAGVLTQQYRMDPKICALISDIGYSGRLTTAKGRASGDQEHPKMFDDPIIIIDTSSIYPFCEKDPFNSKSNVTHALIARNIMREFSELPNSGNIGFCAPFRAQVKLMKKISEDEPYQEKVSIGTVHTFQGDEKSTIIFDAVESLGEDRFIFIPHGQQSASRSSTLTVAVSRAEHKLIFIANLRYLDDKIPAQGYFRHILYKAQETGSVIDARSVINLETFESELSAYKNEFVELGIDVSNLNTGLANQDLFFPLLKRDMANASKFIIIYSGFYTSGRIADLLDNLKEKIKNKVKVKIIVPPPERNGSMDISDSKQVLEKLESLGVIVEFRANIHQKAVLIDENVVWFGSLNPLSYKSTLETMIRFDHPGLSAVFAESMATHKKSLKRDASSIAEPENPICKEEDCQSKTIFIRGSKGPYYKCASCSKTQNLW